MDYPPFHSLHHLIASTDHILLCRPHLVCGLGVCCAAPDEYLIDISATSRVVHVFGLCLALV